MNTRLAVAASSAVVLFSIGASAQVTSSPGTATIKIDGFEFTVDGEYPATICGGALLPGRGMAYQTKAGDYEITIASENRATGNVPLNAQGGKDVNVSVTVDGKGKRLVRHPSNSGKLIVSDDYRKVEATLELRAVVGRGTATLRARFVCR